MILFLFMFKPLLLTQYAAFFYRYAPVGAYAITWRGYARHTPRLRFARIMPHPPTQE